MNTIYEAKILIVDDEPELLSMVQDILRSDSYTHIIIAENATNAIERFDAMQPDALILDVNLPGMDGFALFELLRTRRPVPALFLSARDEDADRLHGLGLGADDYITKPFLPKELTLRIGAVLRRSYMRELSPLGKPCSTRWLTNPYLTRRTSSVCVLSIPS